MMKEEKIYTPEQAAVILDRGLRYVRELLRDKRIKATKIGRHWYIKENDLQDFIENKRPYIKKEKIEGEPEPQPDCMFYQTCGGLTRCQALKKCFCAEEARECKFFKSMTKYIEMIYRALEDVEKCLSNPNSVPIAYETLKLCRRLLLQEKHRLLNPEAYK